MQRRIGVCLSFLNAARQARIEEAAAAQGFAVTFFSDEAGVVPDIGECEVLFGMFDTALLKTAKPLRWVHCSFAGVDRFLSDDIYPNPDVQLTNSSGAYGVTLAEHVLCVMLMMLRRMPEYVAQQMARGWQCLGEIGSIYGSTVTVVGLGDIGSNVARRLKAMGATVRAVRRTQREKPDYIDQVYLSAQFDEAINGADIVVLCVPSTEGTQYMMSERHFCAMKPGSYFVNVGRGNAIDQQGLYRALCSGHLRGAALDVCEPEPLPPEHVLRDAPNLLLTPHVAGNITLPLTCDLIIDLFLSNLQRYATGQPLHQQVDRTAGY